MPSASAAVALRWRSMGEEDGGLEDGVWIMAFSKAEDVLHCLTFSVKSEAVWSQFAASSTFRSRLIPLRHCSRVSISIANSKC